MYLILYFYIKHILDLSQFEMLIIPKKFKRIGLNSNHRFDCVTKGMNIIAPL